MVSSLLSDTSQAGQEFIPTEVSTNVSECLSAEGITAERPMMSEARGSQESTPSSGQSTIAATGVGMTFEARRSVTSYTGQWTAGENQQFV